MPSLFAGTDELICSVLEIQSRGQLNNRALRIAPLPDDKALHLLRNLYEQMAGNVPRRIKGRSTKLWQCRYATDIADHHQSQEMILEKAVALLAEGGHMPGWFNQCPVGSGITDSHSDRSRAVDLVHLSDDTARLIELKWASNTPAYALFQLLEYGLAYVVSRLLKGQLGLGDRRLMHVRNIVLQVVGPRAFFRAPSWPQLFTSLGRAVESFAEERSGGAWSMSLQAYTFPEEFTSVPFLDGKSVQSGCRTGSLTNEGRMIRDAFLRLAPAPTELPDRVLPSVPGAD